MSYYDDPNRNDNGTFNNHLTANPGEQFASGVNPSDNYITAHLKVQNQRMAEGRDPLTGLYPNLPAATYGGRGGSGAYAGPASRAAPDASQFGAVLWGFVKMAILWPALLVAVLAGAAAAAAAVGRAVEGPTLAAKLARTELASYAPTPLAERFPAKDLSKPVDPGELLAALRAHHPDKRADPKMLRAQALMGMAYRCLLQDGCREGVARLDSAAARSLPNLAAGFVAPLAAKGDESAARDACLIQIKFGTGYEDAIRSRNQCDWVAASNRRSQEAQGDAATLDASWAMRRAEAYALLTEITWRATH